MDAPQVELGEAPDWCVDGVYPRWKNAQPGLIIGRAFDTLSPAEKQGALAEAIVVSDLQRAGRYRPVIAALFIAGVLYLPLSYLVGHGTGIGVLPELAGWQVGGVAVLVYVATVLAAQSVWARSIIYRLDRRMTEVLGNELVALMLDLDERSRIRARGLVGVQVKLVMPSKARRARRLAASLTATRHRN
ncbi:hypothetical protein APR11_004813 [Nocardia amikacinitolerans]|nr:hypothetical protein [Nocardia amikacinitolerans]